MEIIYHHFECLASTQSWARTHLASCSPEKLTVITADCQTSGRGQYGRRWISPPGINIYASFVFFERNLDPLTLNHLLALSASHLLQTLGVTSQIKWPNDLMVDRKKIGGILCETTAEATILGIGLNVNMPPEQLSNIDQPATSLLCHTGLSHPLPPLIEALATQFASNLTLYIKSGFTPFSSTFQKLLCLSLPKTS